MNGTRRTVNRAVLAVLGLVLMGMGAALALAGGNAEFARNWTSTASGVWDRIQEQLAAARIAGQDSSWWTVALLAALIAAAVLLVGWMALQGAGRSGQLLHQEDIGGSTTLDAAVAAQAVDTALAGSPQILGTSVQAWKNQGGRSATGLKITVQARKGASPLEIRDAVEQVVAGMDQLLGREVPVLIRIKAGTRTKLARAGRVA